MFNPTFTDESNAILKNRLSRISSQLRNIVLSTAEDYQAKVYSDVNSVLDVGEGVSPLKSIESQGPAIVGDVEANYTILNNDADDIASEVLSVEDATSTLFNLAAASQNQLRQQIRESLYASTGQVFQENFLNAKQVASNTATLDFNAGVATNTLLDEKKLAPVFSAGPNSTGSIDTNNSLDNLSSKTVGTTMKWNGATLELILTLSAPQIVNRLYVNLDDYQEIEIDTFTTSPDGTVIVDVLEDLGVRQVLLNATSNKFSGDVIIDFPPRYCSTLRIILFDRVGQGTIVLRSLSISQRRYQATGQLTSIPITKPTGVVSLSATALMFSPYTSVTHQISYDGVSFSAISPGSKITLLTSPFYHRVLLSTNTSVFSNPQGPLNQSPLDPVSSSNYSLSTVTTIPLGNGIVERTLQINSVTGPIVLRDVANPNSIIVQEGSVILSAANGDYSYASGTFTFPEEVTGITISYQTSALGPVANTDLLSYYTPLLYEYKFEA